MTNASGRVLDIDFAEKSGLVAGDASRYGNDGALTGCKWVEQGLEFNGSSDFVNCGNDESLNFGTGDFTLAAWIKTTDVGNRLSIVSKSSTSSVTNGYFLQKSAANNIFFEYFDGSSPSPYLNGISPVNDGNWHNVTVSWRGDMTSNNLYIDGILECSGAGQPNTGQDSTYNVIIGALASATSLNNFNGSINDVRIYNRALNASEIKADYDSTKHRYK